MKGLAAALVGVTLMASACGSGSHTASNGLNSATFRALPQSVRTHIRSMLAKPNDGPTHEIDVYGPDTHLALADAAMGDGVIDHNGTKEFWLVVLHGRYVCRGCSSAGPTGVGRPEPPHGTIETSVWSPKTDVSDWGIAPKLPAAMSKLHPLAVITLS